MDGRLLSVKLFLPVALRSARLRGRIGTNPHRRVAKAIIGNNESEE